MLAFLIGCQQTENTLDFNDYKGKWVVINYWAEWCGPCIEEIPELNQLSTNQAGDVVVLGVNFDRLQDDELESLVKKMGIQFRNLPVDPADQLRLSRPAGLPTTYIFNPSGELAGKLVGPQSEQSILDRIARFATATKSE